MLGIVSAAVAVAAGELGVNYNGVFSQINDTDLKRTQAKWVRGFVDYYEFKAGRKNGIAKLAPLRKKGYRTILNLKFNFENRNIPVGAAAIQRELSSLNTVLSTVYPLADLLVCGNEPFIESKRDQRDSRLSDFYIAVAQQVRAYRKQQTRQVPLYIGAFNNLWKPSWQIAAATDLLSFARNNSWIAGIDLHIHHTEMSDIDGAFEYVEPRIRSDQKILVTEFSMKNFWKEHLKDPIPRILVSRYSRPTSWQVYQYLNYTIHHPVTRLEWVDFLSQSPWFEDNKDYLTIAWRKFEGRSNFQVATYGIYQNAPKTFTAHTDPWIINPLFVNATVVPTASGRPQPNYVFLEEFRAIQHPSR